jgi:L-ribulose-5-phosphate 3-epimerase
MLKSINGWTFAKNTPWDLAARQAREVGFQAIEPVLAADGELTPTTTEDDCRRIGDGVREAGLEVASLATGLFWDKNYTSADPADREDARELTKAALSRARWLGAPVLLVIPGLVSHPRRPTKLVTGYVEALRLARESLGELCHDAEACGVVLGIENVWSQFLTSPVEFCEFIDRINSAWVGAYLDTGNILRYGFPQDWIDTLGHRLVRVHFKDFKVEIGNRDGFCPLGEGDVAWPEVMGALRRQRYDGPLTYEGPGTLVDVSERMDRVIASTSHSTAS